MDVKCKAPVMLFCLVQNMKLVAETNAESTKWAKKKCIFQITVGSKKNRFGVYLQINNGEILAKHGIYENKPDCRLHFFSLKNVNRYFTHLKGAPVFLYFNNPFLAISFKNLVKKTLKIMLNKKQKDEEVKPLITKLYFSSIFTAINELGKADQPVIKEWLRDSPKKTYSVEVRDKPELTVWMTTQNGSGKVLLSQSTILTPFCTILFSSIDEAIAFYNMNDDERDLCLRKIVVYKDEQDKKEIDTLINIFGLALSHLK